MASWLMVERRQESEKSHFYDEQGLRHIEKGDSKKQGKRRNRGKWAPFGICLCSIRDAHGTNCSQPGQPGNWRCMVTLGRRGRGPVFCPGLGQSNSIVPPVARQG